MLAHRAQELQPVHLGHGDVADDDVEAPCRARWPRPRARRPRRHHRETGVPRRPGVGARDAGSSSTSRIETSARPRRSQRTVPGPKPIGPGRLGCRDGGSIVRSCHRPIAKADVEGEHRLKVFPARRASWYMFALLEQFDAASEQPQNTQREIRSQMSAIEREVIEPHEQTRPPDKTQLAHYYRQMLAIRRMEEALAKAYSLRKFGGFLHLYIGQEAVAVGALAALKPDDYVIATYREHAHAYAKGMSAPRRSSPSCSGRRPAARRGWAARCTCSTRPRTSWAATASSAGTSRWRPAPPSRRSTAATAGSPSASSATAPSPRAPSTRPSRWPRCGSCRWCSSARTTSTRWARRCYRSLSVAGRLAEGARLRHGARPLRRRATSSGCATASPRRFAAPATSRCRP